MYLLVHSLYYAIKIYVAHAKGTRGTVGIHSHTHKHRKTFLLKFTAAIFITTENGKTYQKPST